MSFNVKSWSIREIVVDVKDDVNGEPRARLQVITEFYDCTFECFEDSTTSLLENALLGTTTDDAFQPPLAVGTGQLFQYQNGGSQKAFVLNACTRPPIDMKSSGRTERVMHTCHVRAQYFLQVGSTA
jgi:hypothetical protein